MVRNVGVSGSVVACEAETAAKTGVDDSKAPHETKKELPPSSRASGTSSNSWTQLSLGGAATRSKGVAPPSTVPMEASPGAEAMEEMMKLEARLEELRRIQNLPVCPEPDQ